MATLRRVSLTVWIVLGVVAIHALLLWAVSDRRFLPRARYVPPAPTPNFAAGAHRNVDPRTGETTTEQQFQVSTALATPPRGSPPPSLPAKLSRPTNHGDANPP